MRLLVLVVMMMLRKRVVDRIAIRSSRRRVRGVRTAGGIFGTITGKRRGPARGCAHRVPPAGGGRRRIERRLRQRLQLLVGSRVSSAPHGGFKEDRSKASTRVHSTRNNAARSNYAGSCRNEETC